jgi:hypothetical protein
MSNDVGVAIKRATSGQNNGEEDTAGGGIARVNVFDGLFLRAQHLNSIQDYARDLAMAVGVAGGPGVVSGFRVTLKDDKIEIAPGLAVDPYGRPLRSWYPMTLSLDTFDRAAGNFAWVEIVATSWTYGNESVQGVLCDDPCAGGATSDAHQAEGVLARLVPQFESGLEGTPSIEKRSRLASLLFARERYETSSWPFPGDAPSWPRQQQPLLKLQSWLPPASPGDNLPGVRLAVIIPDQDAWQLDTWTARRERGDSPPMRYWQTQLGMRPWDVFVAQVLQFQDLLGVIDLGAELILGVAKQGLVTDLEKAAQDLRGTATKAVVAERLLALTKDLSAKASLPLSARGIVELPPAGFLTRPAAEGQLRDQLIALLGGPTIVDLRMCHGPISDLGGFLQEAQNRDRIPLTSGLQPIDIFVLDGFEGDWVAFARREQRVCAVEAGTVESVDVFVIKEEEEEEEEQEDDLDGGAQGYWAWRKFIEDASLQHPVLPEKPEATVKYPQRGWALPIDGEAISEALFEEIPPQGGFAIAIVSDESRRAVGVARAGLLALHVNQTEHFGMNIRCVVDTQVPESVVVLIPRYNEYA